MPPRPPSAEEKAGVYSELAKRFVVFREMYSVRKFRLVLCADVRESAENDARGMLERVWEEERKREGVDFSHGVSIVISDRRSSRICLSCGSPVVNRGGSDLHPGACAL